MQLLLGDGDSMNLERAHDNSELNKATNWVYCPSSCMSFQVSAPVFGYSGTGKQAWCMLTLHYTEPEVTFCWCNVVSYVCISWIIYGPMGSCELSQSISYHRSHWQWSNGVQGTFPNHWLLSIPLFSTPQLMGRPLVGNIYGFVH